jgi:hypothetical protein
VGKHQEAVVEWLQAGLGVGWGVVTGENMRERNDGAHSQEAVEVRFKFRENLQVVSGWEFGGKKGRILTSRTITGAISLCSRMMMP